MFKYRIIWGMFLIPRFIECDMNDVLMAIGKDEDRAEVHAERVLELFQDDFRAHVLHVFEDNPEGASITNFAPARPVSNLLDGTEVEVELHERSGEPSAEIIQLAGEIDADVISMAGRKRSPTGKVLFGSVSQDVILSTTRSVLVCGSREEE